MVDVPAATPVAIPEEEPMVATEVLLLLQLPPPASVNEVVAPTHTFTIPVINGGPGLTVTVLKV